MKNERMSWMPLMTMMTAGFLACSPGPDRQARNDAVVPDLEQARAAFQESAEQRMQALQEEMKQLKDQVGDTDEVPDVQVRIEQWERRYQEIEDQLESKKAATLDEWRAFESEIDSALDQLRASYDDLASDLRASLN